VNIEVLKVAGVLLSLAGTVVLAIRVTKMLDVLTTSVKMFDLNMRIKAARASGNRSIPNIRMYGMDTHIDGVERQGTKLLVFGFALQIIGGVCTALSFIV
jgi:hypothetical protein